MATGTTKRPPVTAPPRESERYIQRQLGRTQWQICLIDLASSLMLLVVGVLAVLLLLAIVDHWLLELTPALRWIAWAMTLGASGYYIARHVVPLLFRPINPAYAAKAIEEAAPSLKNSLLNFVLFRINRGSLHEVVYDALEQRAATDLHAVPLEHAVDRSKVIYVGYLLAGVLALGAIYKILSPKDPFQSVARVATPWAAIERPSRVRILDVRPGDAKVFQGEGVNVSAIIQGSADNVKLVYSTVDGEVDEVAIQMQPAGLRYETRLPEQSGLEQSVSYRIEAGDAKTATFQLEVSPAPHILVEQLHYDFPEYTRRPDETVSGQGDVKALEGTRVTVQARANQTIRSAWLEFTPDNQNRQRVAMDSEGTEARGSFGLQLQADRRTPTHASYEVHFTTDSGHENRQPILHRIEVTPDLPPEIEFLTPTKELVEVPLNGSQLIEVRGLDPDFGLASMRLRAVAGGQQLLDESLFEDAAGTMGQVVGKHAFRPAAYDLQPGDRVTYRALAADNRTAPSSLSPEPNHARTKDYQLLIVPPVKGQAEGADSTSKENQEPKAPKKDGEGEMGEDGTTGTDSSEQGESGASDSEGEEGSEKGPQQGEGQGTQASDEQQEGAEGEATGNGAGEQGANSEADGGQPQAGQNSSGTQSGSKASREGEEGQGREGAKPGGSEPLHDGEVFEKALEHLKQKLQEGGRNGKGQSAAGEAEAEPTDSGEPESTGGNEGPAQGKSEGDAGQGSAEDKLPTGDEKDSSRQQADPEATGQGAQHADNNLGAGAQKQAAPGEGGSSEKPDGPTGKNGAEPDDGDEREPPGPKDMREKEPGSGDTGDSGAGQNSEETEGTGAVEAVDTNRDGKMEPVENRDRPKSQQPDTSEPQRQDDPGFTMDKKQSDSKGDASGDRSGGGKKGPGQGANQAGNDSPGQNNASDEGAGKATESGNGETSSAPGQKERAEGMTGAAGNERGDGSTTEQDPSGSKPDNGTSPPRPSNPDRSADPSQMQEPTPSRGGPQAGGDGVALGGGLPADANTPSGLGKYLDVPPGDEANLEYARRATNLVLEYLKDQQEEPDRELLDELGWTKAELAEFLRRWQQLKETITESEGTRELDENLRSLGLRPQRDRRRQGIASDDQLRGLQDAGSHSTPPPHYQRLIDAFKKGTNRAPAVEPRPAR